MLESPPAIVHVDLPNQTLTAGERIVQFPIDRFFKQCLIEGVDELGYILQQQSAIAAYEAKRVCSLDTRS